MIFRFFRSCTEELYLALVISCQVLVYNLQPTALILPVPPPLPSSGTHPLPWPPFPARSTLHCCAAQRCSSETSHPKLCKYEQAACCFLVCSEPLHQVRSSPLPPLPLDPLFALAGAGSVVILRELRAPMIYSSRQAVSTCP